MFFSLSSAARAQGQAQAQAPARPAGMMRYRVRAGDSCVGLARRFYGDARAYERIHRHNPGLGPTPHRLQAGTLLLLPRRGMEEAPAHLSAVRRRVEHRPPSSSRFSAARRGELLRRGSHVRTLEEASAELTFADRSRVQVREQTLVIVYGGSRRFDRRSLSRAELERGTLRSHLGALAGLSPERPIRVDTPGSRATLPGAAVVSVEEDGSSRVANHGSRAATIETEGGGRLRLPGGTGTVVRGGRPSPPRRLLPAPRWVIDPGGPVLAFAGLGATVRGSWEPVRGARAYRVEISRRPGGGDLVEVLRLPGEAPRFTAQGLTPGTYYVRVASVDAAGLEGRRSPRRVFSVREARLIQPGGAAPELPAPQQGEGESAERMPRVLPGTWVVAPGGFSCGEGSDRAPIYTLRELGRREITCVRSASGHILSAAVRVEGLRPVLGEGEALVRERRNELRILLEGARPPPLHALLVEGPEPLRIARPRLRGERTLVLPVTPRIDAADRATLRVSITAGTERILLGELALAVTDPPAEEAPTGGSAGELPSASPAAQEPALSSLWGRLPIPASLGLTDPHARGIAAWAHLALLDAAPAVDPQLRVGVGVRARLPQTPLSIGFATQLDALQPPVPLGRRGDADLWATAELALYEEAPLGLALSLGAWIPTRSAAGLTRARLAPSLSAALRPLPWLALRTRQGALIDAVEEGAALWAFAIGADLFPVRWLGLSVELDGSVGRFADRATLGTTLGREGPEAALTLGAALTGRWGWLEASLGARAALTEEAQPLLGAWTLSFSLSARSD